MPLYGPLTGLYGTIGGPTQRPYKRLTGLCGLSTGIMLLTGIGKILLDRAGKTCYTKHVKVNNKCGNRKDKKQWKKV
jgi:hypothetical protein